MSEASLSDVVEAIQTLTGITREGVQISREGLEVGKQTLAQTQKTNGRVTALEESDKERTTRARIIAELRASGVIPSDDHESKDGINISYKAITASAITVGGVMAGVILYIAKVLGV